MAEEDDSKPADKEQSGKASQPKFRQIKPGKDHAIVVNGQQVVLFDAPKKVSAKSEVVLPGYHLNVYDRVYLRVKESRFSPVNLHRAYADSDPMVFSIPDFDNFLKEGDAIWVELVSTKNPQASGYLFPYVLYSLKGEEDEEAAAQEKTKKKSGGGKGQGDDREEAGQGLGFTGLAVAAAGETMSGLVKSGTGEGEQGAQAESVKDKLKKALEKGDIKALKAAIDEAKKNGDIESLKEMYKQASGSFERALFEDALGLSDFIPKAVPEEDTSDVPDYKPSEEELEAVSRVPSSPAVSGVGTVAAGLGTVLSGGTAAASAGFIQESQTGNVETISRGSTVQGAAVRSGRVSGKRTVEVERTSQVSRTGSGATQTVEAEVSESGDGASGSVVTNNQTQVSVETQGQQRVSSRQTISGTGGGGKVQGKTSTTSETEIHQQTEDSVKARVQGEGGSVAASGASESSVVTKAKVGSEEVVSGGGAEAEMDETAEAETAVKNQAPLQQKPTESSVSQKVSKPGQAGGAGRTGAINISASQISSAAGGVPAGGSLEGKVSSTAQFGFSPIGQGSTAKLGVDIKPGMPGVQINADILKAPLKGPVEKPGAEIRPTGQIPVQEGPSSGGKIGIGLKVKEDLSAAEERKPEKSSPEEEEILSQISPDAKQAALSFMAKRSAQMKKTPGVTGPGPRKSQKAESAGGGQGFVQPGKPISQTGKKAEHPDEESRPQEDGKEEKTGDVKPNADQRKPAGIARRKPSPGAAEEAGEPGVAGGVRAPGQLPSEADRGQKEVQPVAPVIPPISDEEEERPQGENQPEPENEDSKNQQVPGEEAQQQASAYNQAVSDQLDKLAESKKLDAEIKQVTKEASLVVNQGLMEAAAWVWGTSIPSIGLSVLLGAIIGDFLWAFKTGIIKKALAPLLRTAALKKEGDKIAKQIKFSTAVKLNILAMNLVVAAILAILVFLLIVIVWAGCNYPVGKTPVVGYKLSIIGIAGGSSICESLDGATSAFGGGDSGGAGASGSWACEPLSSGPASEANLANSCFGSNASKASSIAGAESGGDPFRPSGVDKCTVDGSVVSWGLFQINISAQNNFDGLNCRSAFDKMYTAQTKDCRVINKPLYDQCVAAAKDAQKNIQKACQMSNNGSVWSAWGANKKCGF